MVGVGNFKQVVAIGVETAVLIGMPVFCGHPASAFGAEAQAGGVDSGTGEDAVAGTQDGVEAGVRDVVGGGLESWTRRMLSTAKLRTWLRRWHQASRYQFSR